MPRITRLTTYPVKGCAGVDLTTTTLTTAGLRHDRDYMVTSPDGTFRTQRTDPTLALITPTADDTGLTLTAPDAGETRIPHDPTAPRRTVTLFGVHYEALDQGDEAADWLTHVLRTPSRLVRVPPDHHRITAGLTPGTCGFADSGAVHILSTATLDHLNSRLDTPLGMDRFRPNIVIDWTEPHTEDTTRRLVIADTELAYAKPAVRCAVTLVDQHTGTRAGPEPLRTLARYRRDPDGGVTFGTKFSVLRTGNLTVGDTVHVPAYA
ncbi:MOSC N-terminal beta barrel domain-containing protein [Saccharothrix violaceirubra]|uniref:MOSC domain-containing protein n=1 Tax=Saccharothrix violaceirubra TaxID=413306 RepID=A0A7W7WWU0_9PSEU|nr:MOSC N-terminal beta barrel domain-containing protein [Saccharothrix violaceirubra]MBB4965943.1 hypothetical protein [Saccharothrix violaceirubra]